MYRIKRAVALILAAVVLLCLCGCESKSNNARIYVNLPDIPKNLDPQTASSVSELMVVRNIFEGLLRKDKTGKIVCGVCESYEQNGLTYTFNIKDNAVYFDGTKLTAYDFEFAFRRAVLRSTGAPCVSKLFAIKNAENIYKNGADVTTLGAVAENKSTFKVTLIKEDKNFFDTLTSALCMPCNEEFFEKSVGKYGLSREYVLCNGSYYLGKWNTEDFGIRLYKNAEYHGDFVCENGSAFLSCDKEKSAIEVLKKESADISFIGNDIIEKADIKKIKIKSFANICWVLTIGDEYSDAVKQSFLMSTDYDVFKGSLNSGFKRADSLFPEFLGKVASGGIIGYNLSAAKARFSAEVSLMENGKFPPATLYYYDNGAVSDAVKDIVGHWQQNLSAFVNITAESKEDLLLQLKSKTLQFAIFPVECKSGSMVEYFANYGDFPFDVSSYNAESILSKKNIKPLFYENTNIAYLDTLKELYLDNSGGYIDFSFIRKDG
ncbi:MAG: ABC transporter substrate-binding protein [Clostridia bacterium]|nr:ABC transporter substrate-binding protein [Clostridia bacterium]